MKRFERNILIQRKFYLIQSFIWSIFKLSIFLGSSGDKSSSNSFIFSLKNKDNLAPFKAPVYRYSQYAIYCGSSYGPIFGGGNDLRISDNANSNTNSYTKFGYTYQPPSGYSYGSSNTYALLAGSYYFRPSEVEVFYLR